LSPPPEDQRHHARCTHEGTENKPPCLPSGHSTVRRIRHTGDSVMKRKRIVDSWRALIGPTADPNEAPRHGRTPPSRRDASRHTQHSTETTAGPRHVVRAPRADVASPALPRLPTPERTVPERRRTLSRPRASRRQLARKHAAGTHATAFRSAAIVP
jgi:hypothetical protein